MLLTLLVVYTISFWYKYFTVLVTNMDVSNAVGVAKAWCHGGEYTLAVVIPAAIRSALGIEKGDRFFVHIDANGRIVYQRANDVSTEVSP